MSKELEMLKDLMVEFDEMGYEPSITLRPDRIEEINSFGRRLKNVLKQMEKQEKVLNIIKKYFNIKFDDLDWGKLVNIQAKEDDGEWDCTATADLIDYKEDFDALKEWLENE